MAMSVLVYAGNSQLAALQLLSSGTPLAIVILAALVINLRFCIYSLSMAPHLAAADPRWRPLLSYLLTGQRLRHDAARLRTGARCGGQGLVLLRQQQPRSGSPGRPAP